MKKRDVLNYYDEFIKNAGFAVQIATILKEYLENFDSKKSKEYEEKVHKLENDADRSLHRILKYLITDFLPPIERDDIINLSHRLDDVVDEIDEVVINLDILDVTKLRDDIMPIVELIYQSTMDMQEMFERFKNLKRLPETHAMIIKVNNTEEKGDKLYQEAIKNLYRNEKDAIEVQRWTILYNCLEDCLDSCEKVADTVENVMLKHS